MPISDQTTNLSHVSLTGALSAPRVEASAISFAGAVLPSAQWSTTSFNVVAQVVQGSASSFTVAVDAAVKKGDILIPNPFGGAGVSSISSGLVWTSHATQDGQFEFRYSNVSTLVQNQSAQTFALARIRLV